MSIYNKPTAETPIFVSSYWNGTSAVSSLSLTTADTRYIKTSGGTMTGTLNMQTNELQFANANIVSNTDLQVTATNDITFDGNTLVVDSQRNKVGILVSDPAYELDILGNVNVSGAFLVGGSNILSLVSSGYDDTSIKSRVTTLETSNTSVWSSLSTSVFTTGSTMSGNLYVASGSSNTTVAPAMLIVQNSSQQLKITPSSIEVDSLIGGGSTVVSLSSLSIAGSNTQVQFNDSGSLGASSSLTFDKSSSVLTTTNLTTNKVTIDNGNTGYAGQITSSKDASNQSSMTFYCQTYFNSSYYPVMKLINYGGSTYLQLSQLTGINDNACFIDSSGNLKRVSTITNTSGYIGINNSSASYTLDVGGDINLTGSLRINGVAQTFGGSSLSLAGSNTQVQFNDGSSLGASSSLTYDKSSSTLSVPKLITSTSITVGSSTVGTYPLDVTGDINLTGSLRINGITQSFSGSVGSSTYNDTLTSTKPSSGYYAAGSVSVLYTFTFSATGWYFIQGQVVPNYSSQPSTLYLNLQVKTSTPTTIDYSQPVSMVYGVSGSIALISGMLQITSTSQKVYLLVTASQQYQVLPYTSSSSAGTIVRWVKMG